jgi:hypothetical protein
MEAELVEQPRHHLQPHFDLSLPCEPQLHWHGPCALQDKPEGSSQPRCSLPDDFELEFEVQPGVVVVGTIEPAEFGEGEVLAGEYCAYLLLVVGIHIEISFEIEGIILDEGDDLLGSVEEDGLIGFFLIGVYHFPMIIANK